MLSTLLFLTSIAAAGNQFSFTIWDWEPAYRDMEFFKRQVDTCAKYGVNTIELGVLWQNCETSGLHFDFSVLDEHVNYVKSKRLALRFRADVSSPPKWYRHEYSQSSNHGTSGLPSFFDASIREGQMLFVAALADHFAGNGYTYAPAFSHDGTINFGGWDNYESSARLAFHNWLAGRYGSINALNASWEASYLSFGAIDPPVPRHARGEPATDPASADWIRFCEAALTDWITAFAAEVRRNDPSSRVSVPLGECFLSESAAFADLAYWDYSRPADEIVQTYNFVLHGADRVGDVPLVTAIMAGITQRPAILEIDDAVLRHMYSYTVDDLVAAATLALEHGAAGVQVTNWGSTDLATQTWIRAIGRACRKSKLRENTRADPNSTWYYISKWENRCGGDAKESLFERQFALYRKMDSAHMSVRIVTDENLLYEDATGHAIVIPSASVMDGPVRERLRAISLGSRVIASAWPGVYTPEAKTNGSFGAKIEIVDAKVLDEAIGQGRLPAPRDVPRVLRVAAVQFHTTFDVSSNTAAIVGWIEKAADAGACVAVFTEMALTGYTKKAEFRDTLDWDVIGRSIAAIQAACKSHNIYTIVGAPTRDGDRMFCTALTIDPDGAIVDQYEKTYLAGEAWATPGRRLTNFKIDDALCGTIICHDERYPHLVQLRALAGAQLFFYISCESGLGDENKIGPYRAQVQARAVENGVYVVHANAPALRGDWDAEGTSNGHSRIVAPDGNLIAEAGPYDDTMVIADIDLRYARGGGMPAALTNGPAAEWVKAGVGLVTSETH